MTVGQVQVTGSYKANLGVAPIDRLHNKTIADRAYTLYICAFRVRVLLDRRRRRLAQGRLDLHSLIERLTHRSGAL